MLKNINLKWVLITVISLLKNLIIGLKQCDDILFSVQSQMNKFHARLCMWAYRFSPVQHMMETESQFAPVLLPQFSQKQPGAPNQQQQM